jgi:hypothetical protein
MAAAMRLLVPMRQHAQERWNEIIKNRVHALRFSIYPHRGAYASTAPCRYPGLALEGHRAPCHCDLSNWEHCCLHSAQTRSLRWDELTIFAKDEGLNQPSTYCIRGLGNPIFVYSRVRDGQRRWRRSRLLLPSVLFFAKAFSFAL